MNLHVPYLPYCPFDILLKDVFAWRFILNDNVSFWLTISFPEPFVCFYALFSNTVFTVKLILMQKMSLTYAGFLEKKFIRNYIFYFSSLILNYWCSITILWNFRNFEQRELVENLLPSHWKPSKLHTYWYLHNLQWFLLWKTGRIMLRGMASVRKLFCFRLTAPTVYIRSSWNLVYS